MPPVITRRKLIEVALPLEAINTASAREKSIRHGHPSTLHLWWARRPLAAARAVIFAQMVDDPSEYVDTLLADPATRRRAENVLAARRADWAAKPDDAERGPEPTLPDCAADIERQRLFRLIEDLVKWENTTNEEVLERARAEIWQSWRRACADNAGHPRAAELFDRHRLPAFHDPFAGGGALPLEAQRLGLEAWASDLNPVAVLINKAMIEIPPKFAGRPPVNPAAREEAKLRHWKGAQGLAKDVRHYGQWMRDEAEKRIGHLYPKVEITAEMARERPDLKPYVGRRLTVIAWLWARTVKSPNPAFAHVEVPLASTFMLSTKAGKEAWVEPVIETAPVQDLGMGGPDLVGRAEGGTRAKGYRFVVRTGKPRDPEAAKAGTKLSRGANFRCVMSGTAIEGDYIKAEGRAGRMGARLMAIVAEGDRSRVYLSPTPEHEAAARQARPDWKPDTPLAPDPRALWTPPYGLTTFGDLFTPRQLVALNAFSDLVLEARERAKADALAAGLADPAAPPGAPGKPLADGGAGAQAYADAVAVYLAFAVSKITNIGSSIASWMSDRGAFRETFARQAIPMVWDYAEANTFADAGGSIDAAIDKGAMAIDFFPTIPDGHVDQGDASKQIISVEKVVSTDPPYYDNIGYADLSDFFYVWLRRTLRSVISPLFGTLAVPKADELVATPYRHGGKEAAEAFFLDGMTQAMHRLAQQAHAAFPTTIYYAFKQSETTDEGGEASTGWETFLDAVIRAGFGVSGTWPMRTEGAGRIIATGSNALASSIVLVCRPRPADAPAATRRQFLSELKAALPEALRQLQRGAIAPVDLAQAAIGPGMAVFTRYAHVADAAGARLTVREALALINQTLDEVLAEQEGDFDPDTRFAIAWFEQQGFSEGPFGVADVLARAKVTAVAALAEAGILTSKAGKVRLLRPAELAPDWDPATDTRLSVWESVHHLIRALETGGEPAAAALAAKLGPRAETARDLAYRLYVIADRRKRPAEALSYNALAQSWPEILRLAREQAAAAAPAQAELLL
jgi:putative DNA methylase